MSKLSNDKIEAQENSGGIKPLLIAALLMGAIAAVAGWGLGSQIGAGAPIIPQSAQGKEEGLEKKAENQTPDNGPGSDIVPLGPVLTNLRDPGGIRVRLETALVIKEGHELQAEQQAEIVNDFIALLRQMTVAQIKGPTGLMNLREDLLDRARIRSEGCVSALLISSLVVE